ncbi:MAG: YraN family protein [Nocardioidaceae bacterium]
MPSTARRRTALGAFGERLAERHLVASGMVILDRNWRCEIGELDLVARDGDALVAVEVKTRSTDLFGSPAEGVTPRKAVRLRRLCAHWLATHGITAGEVRVDVVGVFVPHRGAPQIDHRPGVA